MSKPSTARKLTAALLGIGTSLGADAGLVAGNTAAATKVLKGGPAMHPMTTASVDKLKDSMGVGDVSIDYKPLPGRLSSPAYNLLNKSIRGGDLAHPEIMAHELGHAQMNKMLGDKGLVALALSEIAAPLAGAAAGTYLAATGEKGSWRRKAAIPVALGVGLLPALINEGGASALGMKGLHSLGEYSAGEMASGAGRLGTALGTYGTLLALPATVPAGVLAYKWWRDREPGKKRSALKPSKS